MPANRSRLTGWYCASSESRSASNCPDSTGQGLVALRPILIVCEEPTSALDCQSVRDSLTCPQPPHGELPTHARRMRLTAVEHSTIRETIRSVAGPGTRVRLFGSRTDDRARGGDIDLLVEVDHPVASPVLLGARIGVQLQQALGERRIDVVLSAPNIVEQAIHRVARETGIEL